MKNPTEEGLMKRMKWVLAIGVSLAACAVVSANAADIIFSASFDESLEPEKAAGGSGTLSASRPRFVPGIRGQAVVVGAKTYVRYPVEGNLLSAKGSISFLTKPIGWNGNDDLFHYFVSANDHAMDGWLMIYKIPQNKLAVTGGNKTNDSYAATSTEDWKDGQWKHICVTWDNNVVCLYLDGMLAGTKKMPVAAKSFGNEFCIGGSLFTESKEDQAIDDLTIYSAALSVEEVAALYARYKTALEKANGSSDSSAQKKTL